MRYKECRHESEKTYSSIFVISFLCVFLCAAALGSLRLYGLYLEHRISETTGRIEICREKNLVMSRHYSELLSPARIYSYAREKLGMVNAQNVQTIYLDGKAVLTAKALMTPAGVEEKTGFLDYFNPFVRVAHAKN
ncbi:MAG: hypothetical protein LLF78_08400 [Synergistaceae bacterium]|nr:hypothetical protein [Synergistaceae bacterium]